MLVGANNKGMVYVFSPGYDKKVCSSKADLPVASMVNITVCYILKRRPKIVYAH